MSKEFSIFARTKIEEDAAIIDCLADQDDLFHYTSTYGTLYCHVWGCVKCWKLQIQFGSLFDHTFSREMSWASPADSFHRLFWEQQKMAASLSNSRSMRWHPLFIKWCLYLKLSSKAYETIRDSGCISLPSQRTLRDYTHFVKSTSGFSAEVDSQTPKTLMFIQILTAYYNNCTVFNILLSNQ